MQGCGSCDNTEPHESSPTQPTTRFFDATERSVSVLRWNSRQGIQGSLDAMDVALRDAIVLQLLHDALNNIIEAWTEAAAGDDSGLAMPRVEVHLLPCSCPHGPGRQWHTDLHTLRFCSHLARTLLVLWKYFQCSWCCTCHASSYCAADIHTVRVQKTHLRYTMQYTSALYIILSDIRYQYYTMQYTSAMYIILSDIRYQYCAKDSCTVQMQCSAECSREPALHILPQLLSQPRMCPPPLFLSTICCPRQLLLSTCRGGYLLLAASAEQFFGSCMLCHTTASQCLLHPGRVTLSAFASARHYQCQGRLPIWL